jgi:uncharacterized membrane protein YbhN (UPF0104 family)
MREKASTTRNWPGRVGAGHQQPAIVGAKIQRGEGVAAVVFSGWMLYNELRGISASDVLDGFAAIPSHRWLLAAFGALIAYAALAGYDHIALTHIGKPLPWWYVTLCSFTTYALAHNIGGSVISGAVIRYRAYSARSGPDRATRSACSWRSAG